MDTVYNLRGCLVCKFFKGTSKHFIITLNNGGGPISIYLTTGSGGFTF